MKNLIHLLFLLLALNLIAQENLSYQQPHPDILDLVDVELAPSVLMNDAKNLIVFRYRDAFKSIAELSEQELRLAGLRINPKTNIGSRTTYYNNVKIKHLDKSNSKTIQVRGLPVHPRLSNFTWSPDQTKMAFTHTAENKVELWLLDIQKMIAARISDQPVNANLRDVINWFEDSQSMLVKMLPKEREGLIDQSTAIPTGPTISVSNGKKAQNRTYQDLLKNKTDEHNFEQLAHSEIFQITIDGQSTKWGDNAMYRSINFSPDGKYIMISKVTRPFSYLVPYYRFPTNTSIYDTQGTLVKTLIHVPLIEDLPKGFMAVREGMRNFSWRSDQAATLVYAQALDGGDPANKVDYRDEVFQLPAPFKGEATRLIKLKSRYSGIDWGNENIAIAYDYWWNNRNTKSYVFNPSNNKVPPTIIADRNYQDRYSDPGDYVTIRNNYGSNVLALDGDDAFLIGDGFSEKGQFPFLHRQNLKTQKTNTLYQSEYTDQLENIYDFDLKNQKLLVRIESTNEYPNYYQRSLNEKKQKKQLTDFKNPFSSIQDVHKEVIKYKREDGLDLSGTLYLPVGYDKTKKEKKPMILWAYPREYKDKSSAGQTTSNPNKFTYPYYGSPIYWVSRGYVVLDGAAFPIVGEGEEEPNDSFRSQLVANGKAAIDAVDKLGYIDRDRVAVGGHSYGAFMVANLLSHSGLFAAGIARSGAYNRTLTPFGFQSEQRSYWEAPEVYYTMSPFMHADKMKTPLLLIHGEADNNSGTYPLQSERYFNALKGLGATVRLVMLPKESHGYRAKESIMHLLWEQDNWLEQHVKNKKTKSETSP